MKIEDEKQINHDSFGYLPCKWDIKFDGGRIFPIQEFDQVSAVIEKYADAEGFIYPEDDAMIRSELSNSFEDMFIFEPQVSFFQSVYPSHVLCLSDSEVDLRGGIGAFIIYLLAYLFGVRLQFRGWWHDGRIPTSRTHNVEFSKTALEHFISHCCRTWHEWPEQAQKLITNVLYMHSRVPSYTWEWERFMIEYMVFDGCWKFSETIHKLPQGTRHPKRFSIFCEKFGIQYDRKRIDDIVKLRTDLFHETIWSGGQPCTATKGPGLAASFHIRKFNQRLIPAVLGYDMSYVKTAWWIMGNFLFK